MHCPAPLLPLREQSLQLLDTAGLRRLEAAAGSTDLMARAGLSVARLALALWPGARRVSLVCGPGNNGGDGRVAARHLQAQGLEVQVLSVHRGMPLAALNGAADLVIDALLGIGLHGAPTGEMETAIRQMNQHPAPKLAVDLPSGLLADSGHAPGAVVQASATLSLLAPTPGLFTGDGRQRAGQLWLDRLGCTSDEAAMALAGSPRLAWRRHAPRARAAHTAQKGSAGRVWVAQGEAGMAGASRLAARAALAAGAGRVYLAGSAVEADALWPELMRCSLQQALEALPQGVGVFGCGGGNSAAEPLANALEAAAQLVVDADALNAVAGSTALQAQLTARSLRSQRTVLTPHPLEAARLLGLADAGAVQAQRLACAQQLAERFGCTVILKGSGSVIAQPGALPHINTSGHAALGTAGIGDVLAGWLGGLMAQAPDAPLQELATIACAWQGEAADGLPLGGGPLRASELIAAMAAISP